MPPNSVNSFQGNFRPPSVMTGSDADDEEEQLFFVTTYTDFDCLAHGPRGLEAKFPIYVYRFQPIDGSMVLLNIAGSKDNVVLDKEKIITSHLVNPAFTRFHPKLNVVYTCTEDVVNNGIIVAYSIDGAGSLTKLGQVDAGGTSTCYITIDANQKHLIVTNYWNSTLCVIPIDPVTGAFEGDIKSSFDPKDGCKMKAAPKLNGGVNHSCNDEDTIQERQKDPHSHALVLDPVQGCIAYVPDLGKDLIRELLFDAKSGEIKCELSTIPSGIDVGKNANGPRYIEFHPSLDIAYVVNELSSTIAVFSVNRMAVNNISKTYHETKLISNLPRGQPTLSLIQSINTIPDAFPREMNTCGRVTVHPSGKFVIVSNRGHESIAIFKVNLKGSNKGQLKQVGFYHTFGETPRHFQFDASGQFLIVANQDSNSIAVFSFNIGSGDIKFTGNKYRVPSPNFVCNCSISADGTIATSSSSSSSIEGQYSVTKARIECESNTFEADFDTLDLTACDKNDGISPNCLLVELERAKQEIKSLRAQLEKSN